MATPLRTGHVVWAEIADANGVSKLRPAVVVTPDERITASGSVEVVGITSRLAVPLPNDHVLLPWHSQGHPRTGLNRKCAAVCRWVARIAASDIKSIGGLVSGPVLE
jgi:mRNA-degrading endonuclease toxin of MazEF toxin-antitoxin module